MKNKLKLGCVLSPVINFPFSAEKKTLDSRKYIYHCFTAVFSEKEMQELFLSSILRICRAPNSTSFIYSLFLSQLLLYFSQFWVRIYDRFQIAVTVLKIHFLFDWCLKIMALLSFPVTYCSGVVDRDAGRAFAYTALFAWNWLSTWSINHSLIFLCIQSIQLLANVSSPCFLCNSFELSGDAWQCVRNGDC